MSKREVARRLSKTQRRDFPPELIDSVLKILDNVGTMPGLLDTPNATPHDKSNALIGERDIVRARLALNERKRNERRLRELRSAPREGAGRRAATRLVRSR